MDTNIRAAATDLTAHAAILSREFPAMSVCAGDTSTDWRDGRLADVVALIRMRVKYSPALKWVLQVQDWKGSLHVTVDLPIEHRDCRTIAADMVKIWCLVGETDAVNLWGTNSEDFTPAWPDLTRVEQIHKIA